MTVSLDCSMKEIEEKLRKGESISNSELKQAVEFYGNLREMLLQLGREWNFAFSEANRLHALCCSYRDARIRQRKWR